MSLTHLSGVQVVEEVEEAEAESGTTTIVTQFNGLDFSFNPDFFVSPTYFKFKLVS